MNETTNKGDAMKATYEVNKFGTKVTINSGFSNFEIIDHKGDTVGGNVVHASIIRNYAIRLLRN